MTRTQALKIAIELVNKKISSLAMDANAFDVYKMPHGKKAASERKRLIAAREELEELLESSQEAGNGNISK